VRAQVKIAITGLALVSCAAIFAGCSSTEKEAHLWPLVRAERQLAKAEKIGSDSPEKVAEILSAARAVTSEIRKPFGEAETESAVRIYDRAAVDLAGELAELNLFRGSPGPFTFQNRHTGEIYRLRLGSRDRADYPPTYFQRLVDAQRLQVRKGEESVVIPGLGGTLGGIHQSVLASSQPPRFEPTGGYRAPVTSIIDFDRHNNNDPIAVRLRFVNPFRQNTVENGGQRFPMSAYFSAPFLSYRRSNELWLGFINMIRGENMRNAVGLLLIEPYDPDRIPVIFVHGLLSSKYIWRRTALALSHDPEIRRRYHFGHTPTRPAIQSLLPP
jgi:hypothetical protein